MSSVMKVDAEFMEDVADGKKINDEVERPKD